MRHVELRVLTDGFNAARLRFEASRPPTDESFHAIFETLAWAGVIRDRLRSEERDLPPVLDGLWYVRNLVLHQGVDVLEWIFIPGSEIGQFVIGESRIGTVTQKGWWWRPRSEMPEPRSQHGAAAYDAQLASREVVEVLREVAGALPY